MFKIARNHPKTFHLCQKPAKSGSARICKCVLTSPSGGAVSFFLTLPLALFLFWCFACICKYSFPPSPSLWKLVWGMDFNSLNSFLLLFAKHSVKMCGKLIPVLKDPWKFCFARVFGFCNKGKYTFWWEKNLKAVFLHICPSPVSILSPLPTIAPSSSQNKHNWLSLSPS